LAVCGDREKESERGERGERGEWKREREGEREKSGREREEREKEVPRGLLGGRLQSNSRLRLLRLFSNSTVGIKKLNV